MTCTCPTCGSTVEELPVEALSEIALGFVSREIMRELIHRYPRGASAIELTDIVYRGREPESAEVTVRNLVSDIRIKLRKINTGWRITGGKGEGNGAPIRYQLVRDTRPR
jgi:hypothetical protein